jgi:hypothetical protein
VPRPKGVSVAMKSNSHLVVVSRFPMQIFPFSNVDYCLIMGEGVKEIEDELEEC